MEMGQVWSKADFDGTDGGASEGGRGSALAVTAQHPGADGVYGSPDDILAPLNDRPVMVSYDFSVAGNCGDPRDIVRSFTSPHEGGALFAFGDGSVHFIGDSIDTAVYLGLSTIQGAEIVDGF